ncbi:MAG TPA: type II secretion system F family protein [Gammaproteobacteria bacterium]|nr:type II secretion system F family protein [Gammaproteobacteria bacterium]
MPLFAFQGRDTAGKSIAGKRVAQSAESLSGQLFKEGVTPIHIVATEENLTIWKTLKNKLQGNRVRLDELSMFARQMYTLTKTGVSITLAIKQLANSARSPRMAYVLNNIAESLESGQDLSSAMQRYSDVFSPLMISMIRVGQDSGRLDEAFLQLNQYLELEGSAIKRLKAALRYPTFVLVSVIAAIIAVNVFVIPTFARVFAQANIALPAMTVFLVNVSRFFTEDWEWLLLIMGLLITASYFYLKNPAGRIKWDQYKLKIPIMGPLLKRIILMRFSQTFAITMNAGVPIIDGLTLVSKTLQNAYAAKEVFAMREAIQRGQSLSQAARSCALFTPLELQMIAVSEETGELGVALEQIASFYQREVDYDLKRLADSIEPLLISLLAVIILILALAIYLPIWNMVQLVHH